MKVVSLPCSFDNYAYLLISEATGEAAVVDPAEYYPVSCAVADHQVELKAVYCTHHHADHIGGLQDLLDEFDGLEVHGHTSDSGRIPSLNRTVEDGDPVVLGEWRGKVFFTPGHTLGSVCYAFDGHLFTGDTLFGAGCGRLFEGSPEQMYAALQAIKALPGNTLVYFGHEYTAHNLKFARFVEPDNHAIKERLAHTEELRRQGKMTTPSTIELECATNPFLRCDQEEIRTSLAEKMFGEELDPLAVFTALRRLKDGF